MRQILALLFGFLLLAVAVATGAFLLIAFAAAFTVLFLYLLVRQKLTGKPPAFMRVYSFKSSSTLEDERLTQRTPSPSVIDAEFEEIEKK